MIKINIINDIIRICPFDETKPFLEVDEKTLEQIMEGKIVAKNGLLVDNTSTLNATKRIKELKQQIVKFKEDVEQVELFGMQRDDFEQKKKMCQNIVLELKTLENELKNQ